MDERCEMCGAPADMILMETIDGVSKKIFLCRVCYFKKMKSIGMDELLRKIFSKSGNGIPEEIVRGLTGGPPEILSENSSDKNALVCPKCGTTSAGYSEKRRVGCAHCYEVFGQKINDDLIVIHGTDRHGGKNRSSRKTDFSLDEFKTLYQKALAEEDYDEAIRLRSAIEKLSVPVKKKSVPASRKPKQKKSPKNND